MASREEHFTKIAAVTGKTEQQAANLLAAAAISQKGAYSAATAYIKNDVVTSGGNTYICVTAGTGNAVTNPTYWRQTFIDVTKLASGYGATTQEAAQIWASLYTGTTEDAIRVKTSAVAGEDTNAALKKLSALS